MGVASFPVLGDPRVPPLGTGKRRAVTDHAAPLPGSEEQRGSAVLGGRALHTQVDFKSVLLEMVRAEGLVWSWDVGSWSGWPLSDLSSLPRE